jgi:hypothetical protein
MSLGGILRNVRVSKVVFSKVRIDLLIHKWSLEAKTRMVFRLC